MKPFGKIGSLKYCSGRETLHEFFCKHFLLHCHESYRGIPNCNLIGHREVVQKCVARFPFLENSEDTFS